MMFHSIFLTILFLLITSLASSTSTRFPQKGNGFTAPLIPPTSPRSPFYPEILAANNIPTTLTNVTLDRTHYDKWVETKTNNVSQDSYGNVIYNKFTAYYVTELLLGDPVQLVYGVFDTGSDITWVQCESQAGKGRLPYYYQSRSRSYVVVDCMDKRQCQRKKPSLSCSTTPGDTSCLFNLRYMDGTTSKGVMSSDDITLKPSMQAFKDFVFGCSDDNPVYLPGVIGASNSVYSMPKQINPEDPKFSYCISGLSDAVNFVKFGTDAELLGRQVKILRDRFDKSYFIDVIGIQVNGVDIKVDPSVFQLSRDAQTGYIIDSGYDISSLSDVVFNALKDSLYNILGKPTTDSGYELCYQFGTVWHYVPRPKIAIKFRDWVYELTEINAWQPMNDESRLDCLIVRRTPHPHTKLSFLGNRQLLNVNVGHDPDNNILYLQPMNCPTA